MPAHSKPTLTPKQADSASRDAIKDEEPEPHSDQSPSFRQQTYKPVELKKYMAGERAKSPEVDKMRTSDAGNTSYTGTEGFSHNGNTKSV